MLVSFIFTLCIKITVFIGTFLYYNQNKHSYFQGIEDKICSRANMGDNSQETYIWISSNVISQCGTGFIEVC